MTEEKGWQDWKGEWGEAVCGHAEVTMADGDAAHDVEHVRRVVANAEVVGVNEGAEPFIVLPAAWLHDCVAVPKNAPHRRIASKLAAERAVELLKQIRYPDHFLDAIGHAIESHSFSAQLIPTSLEAKVLQDADRLDAIGAIGIARCLLTGGAIDRPLYDPVDPFADHRPPDDSRFTIDHFYTKLLRLEATMQTETGRALARRRSGVMESFLETLRDELVLGKATR